MAEPSARSLRERKQMVATTARLLVLVSRRYRNADEASAALISALASHLTPTQIDSLLKAAMDYAHTIET